MGDYIENYIILLISLVNLECHNTKTNRVVFVLAITITKHTRFVMEACIWCIENYVNKEIILVITKTSLTIF